MTSSAMGGDRRWGSQRRGGMKVLGKVSIPRPINLPSQRLENHGVDPNVEIVPKGTLSWGSRPSSLIQNAWGSLPALSSSPTDRSVHHGLSNGRPSSGGSGTRPSTAGSEKSHDPASGAWGGSSRPSSASGLLASSLSPGSLRPHSAEARPSSSQLSRFAESVGENSVASGGSGHSEWQSASSSFALSSGDFPTLGSERSSEANVQQGQNSHGRPFSSSSRGPEDKASFASEDDGYSNTTGEKGVSTWKRDEPQYHTARSRPSIEKWTEDSQEAMGYANRNGLPQGFEQWHGPPVPNAPFHGSWYRGGPLSGPYGPAGPPSNYPVDSPPFGFYHPQSQVPVQPMPNQQNSTRPGLAAGGPPNGDPYRPHLPESYPVLNHQVMPVRYPGPLPLYDNYSGPSQMKFSDHNERDSSVLGMAGGPRPCFYPRYPSQVFHLDSDNLRGRPSGYGPAAKGQVEASHVHDPGRQGPHKLLLKQHDGLVASGAEENKLSGSTTQQLEKGNVQEASQNRKNDWEADSIKVDKAMQNPKTTRDGASSQQNLISETMQEHNVNETSSMIKQENAKKSEGAQHPSEKKNMTLIDKIEGLNSKARLPDGLNALGPFLPIREDTLKRSKNIGEATSGVACTEKAQKVNLAITPSPKEASNINKGDSSCEITFGAVPRLVDTTVEVLDEGASPQKRVVHGMHGNMDSKGRSRLRSQENEDWKRRSAANSGSSHSFMNNFEVSSRELPEKQESNMSNMTENEFDSDDYKAQRAKLKEIVSQRAKQLQKEEEERTRDQRAKALAKLEELNRRTLGENATHKPDNCKIQPKQEDARIAEIRNVKSAVIDRHGCDSTQALNLSCQNSKNIAHKNSELHNNPASKTTETFGLPVPKVAANITFGSTSQAVSKSYRERSLQMHDSGSLKQKVVGNSRRKNTSSGDSYHGDVLIATRHTDKVSIQADESASSESIPVDNNSFGNEGSSGQHRKKHSRSFKIKHKVDEASRESYVLASAPVEGKIINFSGESGDRRDAVTVVHEPKIVLVTDPSELQNLQEVNQAAEKAVKKQIEDTHSKKMGNQGRLSSSRKALRNGQAVRPVEKSHGNENFMWAPVQQPNKQQQQSFERVGQVEGNQSTQSSGKAVNELGNNMEGKRAEMEVESKESKGSSGKSVNGIVNNMKAKRAEMERYVPKPVAKDLSLQSNTQQSLLPSSLSFISDEMDNSVKDVSEAGGTSSLPHIRNIDSRHNKHGKKHASWCQRNANESCDGIVHSIEESAIFFRLDTALEMTKDQQSSKLETEPSKHQELGGHMGEETVKVMSSVLGHGLATSRGHVSSGRGRRQPNKLFKSGGHYQNVNEELNEDSGNGIPVKIVDNIPVEAQVQVSKISTAPENSYGMGEIRPQWQPKYPKQQHVLNEIQQGNQGSGSQKIRDSGMNPSTKDGSLHIQSAESPLLETHELNGAEISSSSCVETKLERTGKNLREESHKYPSQGATENFDHHIEKQHFSWGRKQSQHGGRFQRGHRGSPYGGNGGWGGPMLEAHKQNAFLSGDRRKPPNSRFEYQPVESHNKKANNSFPGPTTTEKARHEVSSSSGPRYKERGQNASKRGAHYQEKNSGGAVPSRVAAS